MSMNMTAETGKYAVIFMERGRKYEYEYDCRNRLIQKTDPEGVVINRYVYDLAGNMIKGIDKEGVETGTTDENRIGTHYKYNNCGWLLERRVPVDDEHGTALYHVTQYEYDDEGNEIMEKQYLKPQALEGQIGRVMVIRKEYDNRNRLVKRKDSFGVVIEYRYNGME